MYQLLYLLQPSQHLEQFDLKRTNDGENIIEFLLVAIYALIAQAGWFEQSSRHLLGLSVERAAAL